MMTVCQYHVGAIGAVRQACINQVRTNLPVGVGYELIAESVQIIPHHRALIDSQTIRRTSGLVRLTLLMQDPNRIWIDTDIKIRSWPDLKENQTYLAGGSCPACFLKFDNRLDPARIQKIIEEFAKTDLMCPHHWLYALPHELIPESCFEHFKLSNCSLCRYSSIIPHLPLQPVIIPPR